MLVTTWHTPTGLDPGSRRADDGPAPREDEVTPHTRPPADDDGDHMLVRTVLCLEGSVEVELVCEPEFDYGRDPAEWSLVGDDRHMADATGAGRRSGCDRHGARHRGRPVRARHALDRATRCTAALSWAEEPGVAEGRRRGQRAARGDDRASGATGSARARMPDHRWREPIQRSALAIKGLTYMPTGATVAALTTSLPETPGGERNWDYRYTWMRDSTFTLQALHWLNLDWEADEFMQFVADLEPNEDGGAADHVRDRRPARPHRVDAGRPLRVCGGEPGAGRQRRLRPAPERRLRRGAGLDPAAHPAQPAPAAAAVADRPVPGGVRDQRLARTRTRGSGRPAASPSTTSPRS